MPSPTVLKRRLGRNLRNLRQTAGISGQVVADAMHWSLSKLSRVESGEVALRESDVRPLLALYGVTNDSEVRSIQSLARQSRQPGWWQSYGVSVPSWFKTYVGLEQDASRIRNWQPELIPGLLQTERYAREIVRATHSTETVDEIERRVQLRMERQEILDRPDAPQLWVIMGEGATRRIVGSHDVMAEQLDRVAELSARPNITVQVLPFSVGAHDSMDAPFVLFEFSDEVAGSVAYTEAASGAIYMDRKDEITTHVDIFANLTASSDGPERSRSWLLRMAKEYRDEAHH